MARALIAGVAVAACCFAAVDTSRDSPKELAISISRRAKHAEKSGDSAQAYVLYAEAAALAPSNRKYKQKVELLQTAAARQSKPKVASGSDASTEHPILDLSDVFDSLTARELADARELAGIPHLNARPGQQNFDITADARELFRRVSQAYGLDPVFDGDYPNGGSRITFRVKDVDYREALNDLQAATASFVIPLSGRVLMVAKDTPAKRNDLEQTMLVAVPIPQAVSTQELTEISQVVRQVTGVEKIGWDTAQGRIVMRDRVSRVIPALEVLRQLSTYRPEVMVDMEFVQVASSDLKNYGFNVTNNIPAVYLGHVLNNMLSIPSGVSSLLTFGGGKTLIGLGVAQVQAMFNETIAKSDSMYSAQLRSLSGLPATLHVGDKYPVITGGYVGQNITNVAPVFTYENLGLELKVTPIVHGTNEVSLNIETTFEVLTGQSINDIPVIGRRAVTSQARLRNDEWAVIGGLMNTTRGKSVSGFWGLAQLPLIGNLFKQTSTDDEDATVLIGLRPHLLSLPPDQIVTQTLRTGSELHPYIPL